MAIGDITKGIGADFNILEAEDLDDLLFSDYEQSLGEETRERMRTQIDNYEYYEGKQHKDESGNLVKASELERPSGLDYDPTRYATNYFKAIVDRKARWQMSGRHSIHVPRKQIDDPLEKVSDEYEPSSEQIRENERADDFEKLIEKLWKENKMRAKLLQAARDRLIADRVVCKIVYNPRTGKLRWVWRPDYEFIPIYSDDDFEDLIGGNFVSPRVIEDGEDEIEAIKLQSYTMYEGEAYLHEGIYDAEDLKLIEPLVPSKDGEDEVSTPPLNLEGKKYLPLGLDFIPIVMFSVDELLASKLGDGEISDLREQNDILNQLNEDAIDSLKFEMFSLTAVLNTPAGTAEKMDIAPGAVIEARGAADSHIPEIKKIEGGFRWKEAFKDQYMRIKGAMHEISGLPQIVPQEMNFGGLNDDTLHILFQDIIADTEEQWLSWGYALEELHEKSVRYLQERLGDSAFSYDKEVVRSIEDYDSETKFMLPLPDNRKDLVNLLTLELTQDLESQAGAMERLGVDNIPAKKKEIAIEKKQEKLLQDPYGMEGNSPDDDEEDEEDDFTEISSTERRNDNGEIEVLCDRCGGSGQIVSDKTGEQVTCPKCSGTGWYQPRSR